MNTKPLPSNAKFKKVNHEMIVKNIFSKYSPKTSLLLKNDEYYSSLNTKTIEPKLNIFNAILKNFMPKEGLLLIKDDPYEDGVDFKVYEPENDDSKKISMNKILKIYGLEREQNLEQAQEQKKKFEMKQSFVKGEQYYDLYLDAYKKLKQEGYQVVPDFVISHCNSAGNAAFAHNDAKVYVFQKKQLQNAEKKEYEKCSIDSSINYILNAQLSGVSQDLKDKIANLSQEDKVKFYNFFNKNLITHEMQHYKQFVTMIKVYGVKEMKKVVTDKLENDRLKNIDKEYKKYVSEDIPQNLSEDAKIETIKEGYAKHIENLFNVLTQFDEKNCNKSNNALNIYNAIKDSDDIKVVQEGLKQILLDIEYIQNQLEEKKKDCEAKDDEVLKELFGQMNEYRNFRDITLLIQYFETMIDKNMTIKEFYEQSVQHLQKPDYGKVIKDDEYTKIYNSVKDQNFTQDEKEKAKIYKDAYLGYVSIDDDMTAYFHNQLEVEAYTVQAEAALKKLEEYNKRHEEVNQ